MSDLFILMLIPLCIALEGIFSGGEIAFVASDPNLIRPERRMESLRRDSHCVSWIDRSGFSRRRSRGPSSASPPARPWLPPC